MKVSSNLKLTEKRDIIRNYIRKNRGCTYLDIRNATKLKVERYYKNMRDAYTDAGVELSKNLTKRNREKQRMDAITFIKNNPACTVTEIQNKTGVNVIRLFGSIINAYEAAGIEYPHKDVTSGVANPAVIKRCNKFEKNIINLLREFGEVKPKVRMKACIVDCLFKYNRTTFVVEIKDFRGKNNITMHEIKQLVRYMKVLNFKRGLLICPKEKFPKRKYYRNIYINDLEITLLSEEDLRGRSIRDGKSVQLGITAGSSNGATILREMTKATVRRFEEGTSRS